MAAYGSTTQPATDLPEGMVIFLFTDSEGSTQLLKELRELRRFTGRAPPPAANCFRELERVYWFGIGSSGKLNWGRKLVRI